MNRGERESDKRGRSEFGGAGGGTSSTSIMSVSVVPAPAIVWDAGAMNR